MRKLFFLICCLFISYNLYSCDLNYSVDSKKRKYDKLTSSTRVEKNFNHGLKLYSKYIRRPQKLEKRIVYKNASIEKFLLALNAPEISTRLLHLSLLYLDYLSRTPPIPSIQELTLRKDATIDDYSLALKLLSKTPHLDLYDSVLRKILEYRGNSLYDLTQNDYLERPLSCDLWIQICNHPESQTTTLIKYGDKLKHSTPEIAAQAFEKAAFNKKLLSAPESKIKIYLQWDGTPQDQIYAATSLLEMGYTKKAVIAFQGVKVDDIDKNL